MRQDFAATFAGVKNYTKNTTCGGLVKIIV
jgi:hypothetical protein